MRDMGFDEAERARLERALNARAPGEFHFPEIYGEGWDGLYIGDRVKLGRTFLNAVRAGDFPGVEDTGRKTDGGRVYRWTGR
ncbi:hypothetical protein J2R99_000465 [Rhodopseudomonas julia]|uniref:DUF1413 domain-containing protein n=1 Tax=Rhodopseudomonas julia TaxID=200617 RepID=A0ABU0C274_9BRAD|nr:DUF1413 domain-containing protein [Rhodopseudomonas julia]MDQ0324616.1 hypothetical protein [Rhodopseudomonas julia]